MTRWLGVAALCVACSSSPGTSGHGLPTQGELIAPTSVDQSATFAATRSDQILQQAMHYPPALIAKPVAPLSLTASDGTGLSLTRLEARTVIDGPLAFTELHLRFRNPRSRVLEGRFRITMPDNAAISRLAMKMPNGWMEAEMVERMKARRAYEDFLHRAQDPALLEKAAGNEFRARIFPIPANGVKDIIISYSQELAKTDGVYRLPLRGFPKIDEVKVVAQVASRGGGKLVRKRMTLAQRGWKPDRDFEVRVNSRIAGLANENLVVARIAPAVSSAKVGIKSMLILFDTSASRALGFSRQIKRLGELVAALRADHGDLYIAVATYDQVMTTVYQGKASGFGPKQLDAIRAHRPLGASNLHEALEWAGRQKGFNRVLIIGDGIPTAGPTENERLRAAAKALRGKVQRIDMALTGGIRNTELAAALVRGTVATDGVVLDGNLAIATQARRLGQTTVSGIRVAVPGAEWVWPETLDGVQPGSEILVYAGMPSTRRVGNKVSVKLSGALTQSIDVAVAAVARPLVARAAAQARIAKLTATRDRLGPDRKQDRAAIKQQIVAMSTKHRVLSKYTALLVLETERDYARFGIDRKSLADIMTVGKRGVEVFSRNHAVMVVRNKKLPEMKKELAKLTKDAKTKPKAQRDRFGADSAENRNGPPAEADKSGSAGGASEPEPETVSRPGEQRQRLQRLRREQPRRLRRAPRTRRPPPAPPRPDPAPADDEDGDDDNDSDGVADRPDTSKKPKGPPPLTGKMAAVARLIADGKSADAVVLALKWRAEKAGDVVALVALGEALEAHGNPVLAARAYGSIIDLFPSRADMRRMAGQRLERLRSGGAALAADTFAKAVAQRPDHMTGHRLLAYALVRAGKLDAAFAALETGLARRYPNGRFRGGPRILREDLGIVAAAIVARQPNRRGELDTRLAKANAKLATAASTRFVLYWETDANDVDFHIHDGKGGHAYYSQKELPSGGSLYADVTTGYGPECFTIFGEPQAYPYTLRIHYYSRGPMGYGMGKLEILRHDGKGGLRFEQRPYVVMNDRAYVELGTVKAPAAAAVAR